MVIGVMATCRNTIIPNSFSKGNTASLFDVRLSRQALAQVAFTINLACIRNHHDAVPQFSVAVLSFL